MRENKHLCALILPNGQDTLRHLISMAETDYSLSGSGEKAVWMARYIMEWGVTKTPPTDPFHQAVFLSEVT